MCQTYRYAACTFGKTLKSHLLWENEFSFYFSDLFLDIKQPTVKIRQNFNKKSKNTQLTQKNLKLKENQSNDFAAGPIPCIECGCFVLAHFALQHVTFEIHPGSQTYHISWRLCVQSTTLSQRNPRHWWLFVCVRAPL